MEKLLAFVAILGMVAISTNTQATSGCYGGGGGGTCVVNTTQSSSTYEGDSYYANPYQPLYSYQTTMHVVSFGEDGGGIGTITTEGGSCSLDFMADTGGAWRVESTDPCPTLYTGENGWIDITAQAYNNAGYVYAAATW